MPAPEPFNPYAAPTAQVQHGTPAVEQQLASLSKRFAGALIDGVIMMIVVWGAIFAMVGVTPADAESLPFATMLMFGALGFVVYIGINGYFLHRDGQSLGKKFVGTRIVRTNGERIPLSRIILLRILPIQLLGLIPFAGSLVSLVDSVFIFSKSRQTLHDRIADTKVITI
ncbi:putative RDD family membrane protein YckC [Chitinivorax tropicus]|uniref:Putative RDD family membrane protein YckC n=1 Tax=Chitinivorax tropicus TaxID=714531 RepID=A0A840MLC9_9PROT|nr:RDD family protein [Chitinivorax tropicus]MBB5019964.1 putative RDD family membrane protein YckC [Chitinivorax tropicus]